MAREGGRTMTSEGTGRGPEDDGAAGDARAPHRPSSPRPSPPEAWVVRDPEAFARNVARAAEGMGRAASAWLAPRERGEAADGAGGTAADMARTLGALGAWWMTDPARALDAQTRLMAGAMDAWSHALVAASGGEAPDPTPRDKRFQDEDWRANPFFDLLRRAHAVSAAWARDMADEADLDPATRERARFYVEQLAAATSPSNFLVTNPEALKATLASNGENLARGAGMLAEDVAAGGGELRLRQADAEPFELGRNIAVTPGKVIARNALCEVIQYAAQTDRVLRRPLVIVPPWINKFYILDLTPEKSFIDWAVKAGHTVFVVSWAQPDARHRDMGWADYARDGVGFGLDTALRATGEERANVIGYCVGGTLTAATMALHARRGDRRIASATLFTTQVDFTHAGDLKVFVDEAQIGAVERAMEGPGYLDGGRMAAAFNMLRARDLIWSTAVRTYVLGRSPPPFDLLHWNSDATRMGAANHSFYLRNCYLDNTLARGEMVLDGERLDLGDVTVPVYNLAAREDHIAPARSVFEGSGLFGGPVAFTLAGSGHIAGVVNPPARNKYQHWTGAAPAGSLEDWIEAAEERPGSWWPHWQGWIEGLDGQGGDGSDGGDGGDGAVGGERVPARTVGGDAFEPLDDAPGPYVRVKA